MDNSIFTADDFSKRLGDLVARAVSALDVSSLTGEQYDDFMRGVTGRTVNTFWQTYVESLPGTAQSPLRVAIDRGDEQAITAWHVQYANFMEDEHARRLAEDIVTELAKQLPKHVKNDFAAFTHMLQYT